MIIKILKQLFPVTLALTLTACVHSGDGASEKKTETLSIHETVAEFLGTNDHRCRGLTSLCPDECGDSGTMAWEGYINPALTTVVYQSVTGEELRVTYNTTYASVNLLLPEQAITLPQVISASGARYADDKDEFWNKGQNATYKKDGILLFEGREAR